MNPRSLLAVLLLAGACSSVDDPLGAEDINAISPLDASSDPLPLRIEEPAEPSSEDDAHDCVLSEDDASIVEAKVSGPAHRTVGRSDTISLAVTNAGETEGSLSIHAFVFSARGTQELRSIAVETLAAGDTANVSIDIGALGLPTAALERSGRIVFTAELDLGHGATHQPTLPLTRYFHPSSTGAWELYDRDVRDQTFDGGALTEDARRFAREATAAGSTVLDAHVHPLDATPQDDGWPDDPHEAVALAEAPGFTTASSAGGSVNFCFRLETQYDDAGLGEDFWTSNTPTFRDARGLYSRVERYTASGWTSIFEGYTGDGIGSGDPGKGCTGNLAASGAAFYRYRIWAKGQVQGNPVEAWDDLGSSAWVLRSYAIGGLDIVSGGTHQVDISTEVDERLNVLMMVSYALYRHAGGLSGKLFKVRVDDSTRYDSSAEIVYISDASSDEKFKGNHETGHAVGDHTTGGMIVGSNYDVADSICPATADSPSSTNNHSLLSREHSEAAANEGFAHFYSADVFNDHDETDCWFGYYKNEYGLPKPLAINCESGNTLSGNPFSTRFMENECASGIVFPPWIDEFGGHGIELDWLRAFWDVHTNGSSPPHMNTVLDWIDSADEPSNGTAYDELDDAADAYGGVIETNWNSAKSLNGIDH